MSSAADQLFAAWIRAVHQDADRRICVGPEPVLLQSHAPCVDCGEWAGGHLRCPECQDYIDYLEDCDNRRPR